MADEIPVKVVKIGSREFLKAGPFVFPVDQLADIWLAAGDESKSVVHLANRDKFTLAPETSEAFREFINDL